VEEVIREAAIEGYDMWDRFCEVQSLYRTQVRNNVDSVSLLKERREKRERKERKEK